MAMNDDIVFEGGDWKIIDSRDIDYDKAELVPGDHENGTEEHARVWARDFYLANQAFLHSSIDVSSSIAPRILSATPVALELHDDGSLFIGHDGKVVVNVKEFIAKDGEVCCLDDSDRRLPKAPRRFNEVDSIDRATHWLDVEEQQLMAERPMRLVLTAPTAEESEDGVPAIRVWHHRRNGALTKMGANPRDGAAAIGADPDHDAHVRRGKTDDANTMNPLRVINPLCIDRGVIDTSMERSPVGDFGIEMTMLTNSAFKAEQLSTSTTLGNATAAERTMPIESDEWDAGDATRDDIRPHHSDGWYYTDVDDATVLHGPFAFAELRGWMNDGDFERSDLVRHGRDGKDVALSTLTRVAEDGGHYTRADFVEHFSGTDEWDDARIQSPRGDGGSGEATAGSYAKHQRRGGSGHTTKARTERKGTSGRDDSAESKVSQGSSTNGGRRTPGASGHTSRTRARREGPGENDEGAGSNAAEDMDTEGSRRTPTGREARTTTFGRERAKHDAEGARPRAGEGRAAPGVDDTRKTGTGPEDGAHHHHGRGGGANCRSAHGDDTGSGGGGGDDGGRDVKECEDGTSKHGDDG
jgi:hypothetical protein